MGILERRKRDRERRRQQIMVAAKRVFSARGYNGATMEEIATEAELSPGTLYLYFKNKDELYASLSLRILQYLKLRLDHITSDKTRHPERLMDDLASALNDVYEFDPAMLINMLHLQSKESIQGLSERLIKDIADLAQKSMRTMARLYKEGIDQGLYRKFHPMTLSVITWALFSGIVLWAETKSVVYGEVPDVKVLIQNAMEVMKGGIYHAKG